MTNDYGNLELHQVLLAAMKAIDKICREHGLRYYLYAGTLLGAMNHKGFIPWDDDVDIVMFPADFEQLESIINNDYSDRYEVCTLKSNPNWYSAVSKIYIKKTWLHYEHSAKSTPLFIDICTLHSVPDNPFQRFFQRKQLELIELVWEVQAGTIIPTSIISKMTIGQLAKIRRSFWDRCFEHVATRFDNHQTKIVATLFCVRIKNQHTGVNGYTRDFSPREWLENPIDIPFEDSVFMTLADPVTDLNNRYPNWQKPFPAEKRITKHDVKSYEISPEVRERLGI